MNFNDDILKQEVFKDVAPEKVEIIKQFISKMQGKNMNDIILEFMSFYKKMPKELDFTAKEREALIASIYANLSDRDREKLKSVLSLIGK